MKRTHSEPRWSATAASCSSSCMTAIPPAWTVPRGTAGPAGWKTTPNAYDCNSTSRYGVEAWSDYRFGRRGARACRSDEVKTEPLRVSTPDQFAGKPPHWVDSALVLNLWRSRSTADATLAVRLVADDSRMLGMSGKHQNTHPPKTAESPDFGKIVVLRAAERS